MVPLNQVEVARVVLNVAMALLWDMIAQEK